MQVTYPIKIKVNPKFLEEFYECEFGRFEDACQARENETEDKADYETVFCDFGGRWKTQIEIKNDAELVETYYAAASGTIGLGFSVQANHLLNKIRERVSIINPEIVSMWRYQNGY